MATSTFTQLLTSASADSCAEIKSAISFSGVTSSGRVLNKVPESDARTGASTLLPLQN